MKTPILERAQSFLFTMAVTVGVAVGVSAPLAANADPLFDANAVKICNAVSFESTRLECFEAIKGKYYDAKAMAACEDVSFHQTRMECLKTIENKEFISQVEVSNCLRSSFHQSRMDCLKTASTRTASRDSKPSGKYPKPHDPDLDLDPVYDSRAAKICNENSYEPSRRNCFEAIRGKYFDAKAIVACEESTYHPTRMDCLKAIENKDYLSEIEVSGCLRNTYHPARMGCLKTASSVSTTRGSKPGRPGNGLPKATTEQLAFIRSKVEQAIRELRKDNEGKAENILVELKGAVQGFQSTTEKH